MTMLLAMPHHLVGLHLKWVIHLRMKTRERVAVLVHVHELVWQARVLL
jgi:hypothetical protein